MNCRYCGNELKADQRFCSACGKETLNINKLYAKLKGDIKELTSDELDCLIKDFESRATTDLEIANQGDYTVCFDESSQFNGVLVYKPEKKRIKYFVVEQPTGSNFYMRLEEGYKIIAVNGRIVENESKAPEEISEKKQSTASIIGNVIWFILGGLIVSLSWWLTGALWCITIIGIPIGKQCFKFAKLTLAPFGKEIIYGDSNAKVILNILWLIFTGFWSAVAYALIGLVCCITIIGIPFGKQYFKFAKLMLMPFGARVVDK